MPHVTCFQHIDCEGPGLIADVLKSKGIGLRIIKTYKGEPIPENLGDGLVDLGGPMAVYEREILPWMVAELAAIQKCLDRSIPCLGICLGAQMLAHVGGGRVYKGDRQEIGWYPINLSEDGRLDNLLQGLPMEMTAFHWHGDTSTLPADAVRLAGSAYYPNQIFRLGQKAYGFQCHLEITESMIKDWMAAYASELKPNGGPIQLEWLEKDLHRNAQTLEGLAEKVFSRFAALL